MNNLDIRKYIRQKRKNLTDSEQQSKSVAIFNNSLQCKKLRFSKTIAGYFPHAGEASPLHILEQAHTQHKTCLFPVLKAKPSQSLYFFPHQLGAALTYNRFGIAEPRKTPRNIKPTWSIDVILMPLVAFDETGNRLGMGGGFYDRTLAYLKHRSYWKKPHLIGIAYEFQKIDNLKSNNWDIPLNEIITEKKVYCFNKKI
ncbi:MAG: 5-formyltetrahydrofolate cyclo-ligase [Methylococcales bacterium]|jgi:5-formyltetrahydrofolate cyclo-ligase|nr:5-formyltetrahydrofolate cyclo-ligase [Methylococcales bacterium]MBT7409207.1 5-formyltetrahydrofolate cyclo-ligase [Methylococcales bacterium]